MGKRNEPINSLSVLWQYYYEVWIKDKGAFYLILFRISVLKQRLFGESVLVCGIPYHLSSITYHQTIFYNGEFDPGSG